jgi:hypothetical protein
VPQQHATVTASACREPVIATFIHHLPDRTRNRNGTVTMCPLVSARLAPLLPRPRVAPGNEHCMRIRALSNTHAPCIPEPLRARVAVGDLAGPSFTVGAVIKLRGSGGNVRCTPRSHALACAKPHTTGLPRCGGDFEPA